MSVRAPAVCVGAFFVFRSVFRWCTDNTEEAMHGQA